jgi:hypothetical protein
VVIKNAGLNLPRHCFTGASFSYLNVYIDAVIGNWTYYLRKL